MKKLLLASVSILALPVISFAQQNNIGECGWGSKVFHGQRGIAPQVLAVTTNGTSGNQTFGITLGTSGCTQDGVVKSAWKTAMFIEANKTKLARDIAVGQGEALASLSQLLGVDSQDRVAFNELAKANFGKLFPTSEVTTSEVVASLKEVLSSSEQFSRYSENV
jgi:Protein of unknown function (DUF3015)